MQRTCHGPSSIASLLLTGALALFAPACGGSRISSPDGGPRDAGPPDGPMVCTVVGCHDQFAATVALDVRVVPAGTQTIQVTADGTDMVCTFAFPPADLQPGSAIVTQCATGLTLTVSQAQDCTMTQTQTQTVTMTSSQCQPIAGQFTERLTLTSTPSTVHVQQRVGDAVILDQTVSPTYQVNQPNGPACGPTCHQASVAWTIPTVPPAPEQACDPLAGPPIALGAVIGVGQDAAGTLYVDAANGIFVSSGGTLVRQQVVGTGQSGSDQFVFSFVSAGDSAASARDLLVQTDGATAVSMALGPGGSGKSGNSGSDAGVTALTLVDPSTVASMPVANTPNAIQYVGDAANGDVLVATVPVNRPSGAPDGGVEDGGLSIFYGPPSAVAQRPITNFEQSLSGNGSVSFLVDGTSTVLTFGYVPGADAGPFGRFALMTLTPQGGSPIAITLESPTPAAPPSNLTFTCLP